VNFSFCSARGFSPGTVNCILQPVMYMLLSNNEGKGCQTAKKKEEQTVLLTIICQKLEYKISPYIAVVDGLMCCSGSNSLPSLICSNTVKQVSSGRQLKHLSHKRRRCTFGFVVSMWEYLQPKSYTRDQHWLAEIADTIQFDHCCLQIP